MYTYKHSILKLYLAILLLANTLSVNAATEEYENFNWQSPNGWQGAIFDVPTWFAKDMLYTGKEIIRFHDGFYDDSSEGFWTYAFALLVKQTEVPTTEAINAESKRYFIGLARGLGDKADKNYPAKKIVITSTSDWVVSKQSKHRSQTFQLKSFDPFTTGKPVRLNVKVTTWLCSEKYRAIHYSISPHPFTNIIWKQLNKEINALKCW